MKTEGSRRLSAVAAAGIVFSTIVALTIPVTGLGGIRQDVVESSSVPAAELILDKAGISRGICVVLGCSDATLIRSVLRGSKFFVHVLDPDRALK